jgi:hypothetical protein
VTPPRDRAFDAATRVHRRLPARRVTFVVYKQIAAIVTEAFLESWTGA